jgi:hypothetical protein
MEYKIILGSLNLIEKERPIVSYEGHTNTDTYLNDIKKYFIEKNYSIFRIEEACGRDDCRNFLAIPNDINNNINLISIILYSYKYRKYLTIYIRTSFDKL